MSGADADRLRALIAADADRMAILRDVAALGLPDGWIGAGFVRNAVWDHLHDRPPSPPDTDVDVVWFDPTHANAEEDRRIEQSLRRSAPDVAWSVKNQARMHMRNGDAPYTSVADAIAHWTETATAVAMRVHEGAPDILAPFGLADLFALALRLPEACAAHKHDIFLARVHDKRWLERWPRLRVVAT